MRHGPGQRRSRRTRPDSPLPDRDGIPAVRFQLPRDGEWATVANFLLARTRGAAEVARRLDAGEVVFSDGRVVTRQSAYAPGRWVFLYRDPPVEVAVPGEVTVLYRDQHLVVVDKPHFLATMPRGAHVAQTVVVRLRRTLDLPELAPAHRLDRLTAGVLVLTIHREVRGAYQQLFAERAVRKTYLAVAPVDESVTFPRVVRSRIGKRRGSLQSIEEAGEPNAITRLDLLAARPGEPAADGHVIGLYRLHPETGRTHQLRVHMASLGVPILGDPLYPAVREVAADDFTDPLQLLAAELAFTDPLTGAAHRFASRRTLTAWPTRPAA